MKEKERIAALKAAGEHDQLFQIKKRVTGKTSPAALKAGGGKKKHNKSTGSKHAKGCNKKSTKGAATSKAKAIGDAKPKAKAKSKSKATSPPPSEPKPALDMDNTVYYGGGRLYNYPKRRLFRVWTRREDKKDKGVNYGKDPTPTHLKKRWNDALKLIEDDVRPVDVD